ncbi:cytochrome P450 [Roridomyces roridus]|uniref:Cytochrome P450 n=1 Tax=Roridomyces roridus TaxID=1738132 RepID=A0AAD7CKK2_9AGAR|nr:cytochrome P450 [Roridomyces roridus]
MERLLLLSAALLALYNVYRRWTRISLADIPGPEPSSFLLGCLPELSQSQAAEADFKWQARFGHVIRLKGILGTDRLLVSDPKALYHMSNSGYHIRKSDFRSELINILTGPGLAWSNNEVHRRQRRVNSPAFGTQEARSYIPIFTAYAHKLTSQWKDLVGADGTALVDTPSYFSRYALDTIGAVAFDYQFGTTDNQEDPLAEALSSVVPMFAIPSKAGIFVMGLLEFMPIGILKFLIKNAPFPVLKHSRHVTSIAVGIAKQLVGEKSKALVAGKGKKDVLSLLVKANASENPRTCLSEEEMYAQMQTIMQAGHETVAATMSWTLLELARHPEMQTRLRAEIKDTYDALRARGQTELTAADFEEMKYTVAVMKEVLRYHSVATYSVREAARDEVLPLSKPILTKSGKTITELPIAKNTVMIISNSGYNRNSDVFGQDVHVFNPDRFLDDTVDLTTRLGVYGNLMSFGSGHRGCIGWRFAIYEYQSFLIELLKNFEFSIDPAVSDKILRQPGIVMLPAIEGEVDKGPRLPIRIKAVDF